MLRRIKWSETMSIRCTVLRNKITTILAVFKQYIHVLVVIHCNSSWRSVVKCTAVVLVEAPVLAHWTVLIVTTLNELTLLLTGRADHSSTVVVVHCTNSGRTVLDSGSTPSCTVGAVTCTVVLIALYCKLVAVTNWYTVYYTQNNTVRIVLAPDSGCTPSHTVRVICSVVLIVPYCELITVTNWYSVYYTQHDTVIVAPAPESGPNPVP